MEILDKNIREHKLTFGEGEINSLKMLSYAHDLSQLRDKYLTQAEQGAVGGFKHLQSLMDKLFMRPEQRMEDGDVVENILTIRHTTTAIPPKEQAEPENKPTEKPFKKAPVARASRKPSPARPLKKELKEIMAAYGGAKNWPKSSEDITAFQEQLRPLMQIFDENSKGVKLASSTKNLRTELGALVNSNNHDAFGHNLERFLERHSVIESPARKLRQELKDLMTQYDAKLVSPSVVTAHNTIIPLEEQIATRHKRTELSLPRQSNLLFPLDMEKHSTPPAADYEVTEPEDYRKFNQSFLVKWHVSEDNDVLKIVAKKAADVWHKAEHTISILPNQLDNIEALNQFIQQHPEVKIEGSDSSKIDADSHNVARLHIPTSKPEAYKNLVELIGSDKIQSNDINVPQEKPTRKLESFAKRLDEKPVITSTNIAK